MTTAVICRHIAVQYFRYPGGEIFHLVGQLTSPLQARTDCGFPDRRLLAHGLRAENGQQRDNLIKSISICHWNRAIFVSSLPRKVLNYMHPIFG